MDSTVLTYKCERGKALISVTIFNNRRISNCQQKQIDFTNSSTKTVVKSKFAKQLCMIKKKSNDSSYHWLLFSADFKQSFFPAGAESELSKLRFDRVSLARRRRLQIGFLKVGRTYH